MLFLRHKPFQAICQSAFIACDNAFHCTGLRHCKLCRSRGRGSTQVGNKIYDRGIRLVTDSGDNRCLHGKYRSCYLLAVERRQIFGRTAASAADDNITAAAVRKYKCLAYGLHRIIPLHHARENNSLAHRITPAQDIQDILQSRSPFCRYNAYL